MSIFQQGLDLYKSAAKQIKDIEEEPIPEDIESSAEVKSPKLKPSKIEQIKAQAREKEGKDLAEKNSIQQLLDNFKRFLSKEKRGKFMALCEKEDSGKVNFISMMAFNRVLKNMGFRLLFDQVKSLITALNVYDSIKDRVLYNKVIGSTFRKLYRRDPYTVPPKPSQLQAVVIIQRYLKQKKKLKQDKISLKKENITAKDILNGLAQKIHNSGKPLLRSFEEIDKDHSGFIEISELDQLFQSYGVLLSQEHLNQVFKLIDLENLEKISYRALLKALEHFVPTSEDILSTIAITNDEKEKAIQSIISSIKLLFKDSKMTADSTYKLFDKDNKGTIDLDTFISVISRITNGFSQFEIRQVFTFIDTSKDGFISKVEFNRVFFDLFETPAEILKRKEEEERKKIEEEVKAKWQNQRNQIDEQVKVEEKKTDAKPTIADEIKKKQAEIEENQRKEALRKIDSNYAKDEEKKKKEKEIDEKRKKEIEEKQKLEADKKKKLEEDKKKREQDEKLAKNKMGNFFNNLGKAKDPPKPGQKRAGSSIPSNRSNLRKKESIKKTLEEKSSKLLQTPTESQIVAKSINKELSDMIKKEFILPILGQVVKHGDSIKLARQGQKTFEDRGVIKHVYQKHAEWTQEVINPFPRTLWLSGELGRVGYMDDQGYLNQLDLLSGAAFPVLHLGTKPPFQRTPLLASACDPGLNRLYILNKNWVLEVWDLHQQTTSPVKRVKILSKIVGDDYVEKFYKNRYRNVFPKLVSISHTGKVVVNATCVDGFIYFFEPVSMALMFRLRLTINELKVPEPVLKAFEEFSYFIRECSKLGISQTRVFELLDRNGDGLLSFEEFKDAVRVNNLPLNEGQIREMFKAMDADLTGSISIDEFWAGIYVRDTEVASREQTTRENITLPEWVHNISANERAKDCMYKLYRAITARSLSPSDLFKSIDKDSSGSISRSEFSKGILSLLAPLITLSDCELLLQIADRDNSGSINYKEFTQFLNLSKLPPGHMKEVNSAALPRSSIKYVVHKCIELGIDFYKICRDQDKSNTGTLAKEQISSILLSLPVGLTLQDLKQITDRDLLISSSGWVDYQEIFDREEYVSLIKSYKKPGISFEIPAVQEEAAIIEDFEYLEDLGLVAFSTNNPVSSTIYLKSTKGYLVSKCVGHFGEYPPVLLYVPSANTLVSGERRDYKTSSLPSPPPCCIVLWNLQRDLVNKFSVHPPWTLKPYCKVAAHDCGIVDLTYLPVSQLVVSVGNDGVVKLWNPTGRPYVLTETHNLPIATAKPGKYVPLNQQFTQSNSVMALVGVIRNSETACFRVLAHAFDKCEWLVCLNLVPSSSKNICGNLQTWAVRRMSLLVPAKQHDWNLPNSVVEKLDEICVGQRTKMLAEYRAALAVRLEKSLNNSKVIKSFEKEIKIALIRSIIFDSNYENFIKIIAVLPERLKKGKVSIEELYNYAIQYAGFLHLPFQEYHRLLYNISESISKEPTETDKKQVGLLTILKMIEEKKNPELAKLPSPSKSQSLITSIKAKQKAHEQRFDTPMKGLEQELFEFLSSRLMSKKVSIGQLFQEIDQNQDGLINIDEFSQFLQKLGYSLRKPEIKSIMKCIDYNSDDTISFKELDLKLKAFGYTEEWQPAFYSHEWEDISLSSFFKSFQKKNEFRNFLDFFQHFDYNKDGDLTDLELYSALASIDRKSAERIMNVVRVNARNSLNVSDVTKAVMFLEKELPKGGKEVIEYKAMETCVKSFNSIEALRKSTENLILYALTMKTRSKRGLELISRQSRLGEGLALLSSGTIRYSEFIDRLLASILARLHSQIWASSIKNEFNVLTNTYQLEAVNPKKVDPSDFKVDWDSGVPHTSSTSFYKGTQIPDLSPLQVCVYESEVLKHVSRDGTSFYSHVLKELACHTALQDKTQLLRPIQGYHEKYLGLDKTIFTLYSSPKGVSFESLIQKNGGLLKIPLLYNTKVSVYLFKYWGRKVLNLLHSLHSYSISLRLCTPDKLLLQNSGSEVLLTGLQGIGHVDSNGKIVSAPDVSLCIHGQAQDCPYLAPEFYLQSSQTLACDVWSFGVLMYSLLFGTPPAGYVRRYSAWKSNKFINVDSEKPLQGQPAATFPYNIFENTEVVAGQAQTTDKNSLNLLRSLRAASYSGLVYDQPGKSEIEEIENLAKTLKDSKNSKSTASNEIGRALDAISLCLQVDPAKRPTVRALLNSPLFTLDKYEEKQAKSFAGLIFEHRNPEIVIKQEVTQPVGEIMKDPSLDKSDELISLIEKLGTALLDFGDDVVQMTSSAIFDSNLTAKEKDLISKKGVASPISELSSQCIKDEVFESLAFLALHYFANGDNSVLLVFANLLKYLLYHLNSPESGLSTLVSVLIETLLKLFMGEDTCLASKSYVSNYVLKASKWTPELYDIMSPIYRSSISESGHGHHNCPIIKEFLSKNRHADYYSELMMIAENFNLILKPESTTVAKRNALRHLKSMLQTRNEYKTLAALDFKLPQFVVHCLQDSDFKVRLESINIFLFLTQGCVEPVLPKLPGVTSEYRSLGIINFFSIAKKETHETTKNFEKISNVKDSVPISLKMLAVCFENAIFIFPIVRLIKFKAEPYETKEAAVKILCQVLAGNEKCQLACLSPITDTVSTLCKCLVVSNKTADLKSGRNLAAVLKGLIADLLVNARSYILASFKNTPGAEALLKEQGLVVPDKVSLPALAGFRGPASFEANVTALVQNLKNWLTHEKPASLSVKEQEIVTNCMRYLRDSIDLHWSFADVKSDTTSFVDKTLSLIQVSKGKIRTSLLFLEWSLFSDLDCGWFRSEDNLNWLLSKAEDSLLSASSGYQVFYLEEETMLVQRIMCRLLCKEKVSIILGKVKFGLRFAQQLISQYSRLGEVITKHTEPLHVLEFYPKASEIRLASFMNLIQFSNLQSQLLESDFVGILVQYFLNDSRVLNVRFSKLSIEFLPFRETPPVRSEAINIVMILMKEKAKCKVVYDDLLLHLQRFKTVQREIMNCLSSDLVLQATALELVQAFIAGQDPQIEYLLMQGNAKGILKDLCLGNKDIALRFPVVASYCRDS